MTPSALQQMHRFLPSSAAAERAHPALYMGLILSWPGIMAMAHDPNSPTDYLQYSIGALLLIQTILIVALLVQNRRHRRVEQNAAKLQSEMTHAARLAIAGEITASIVHEMTQPLSAILSNVETAELLLSQPNENAAAIGEILADIRRDDLRANEISRGLRTLLRKRELQFEELDINAHVASVVSLVRADATRRSIMIRTDLSEDVPPVRADPVHFQQVLLNLILNAMDAMEAIPPTARWLDIHTRATEDGAVEVAVIDTGRGMTADQQSKIFESFFTTKEGGMGLGLSIARSIVQAHGGKIWAETQENSGTTFRFTLPARRRERPRRFARASGH
jgi:signal transduction histidine kinase